MLHLQHQMNHSDEYNTIHLREFKALINQITVNFIFNFMYITLALDTRGQCREHMILLKRVTNEKKNELKSEYN